MKREAKSTGVEWSNEEWSRNERRGKIKEERRRAN